MLQVIKLICSWCYTLCVLALVVTNVDGQNDKKEYHYVNVVGLEGKEGIQKCDNKKVFCLDSNNGARPKCIKGNCICFHFDQDFDNSAAVNDCQIIDGGYCSTERFGESGRPAIACKAGSSCIKIGELKYYMGDDAEHVGICCPNNTCSEFLDNVKKPERGNPCDYASYRKAIPPEAIDKSGYLTMTRSYLDEYVNRMLWTVRIKANEKNHLVDHCFQPKSLYAPKGTTPLFELRCLPTNKCDCGYSQVYRSLVDEDREYYDTEGKWVVAPEPRGQPMVYDPKAGECRLPVRSNCTNYDGSSKSSKNFESCSSELKCCRKSYYDDREMVKKDIIGYCATSCPNFATSLQCYFVTIIFSFMVIKCIM